MSETSTTHEQISSPITTPMFYTFAGVAVHADDIRHWSEQFWNRLREIRCPRFNEVPA
jgi:hypothetical protein